MAPEKINRSIVLAAFNAEGRNCYYAADRLHVIKPYARNLHADILGVLEFGGAVFSTFAEALHDDAFYRVDGPRSEDMILNPIFVRNSRFEVVDAGWKWLSPNGTQEVWGKDGTPRAFTWADLKDLEEDGKGMRVYNTQLANKTEDTEARLGSIERMLEHADSVKGPVVFMGDLNISPSSHDKRQKRPKVLAPLKLLEQAGFKHSWRSAPAIERFRQQEIVPWRQPPTFHNQYGLDARLDQWGTWDNIHIWSRHLAIGIWNRVVETIGGLPPSDTWAIKSRVGYLS